MVASREAGYLVYGSYGIIYHWRIFALVLSTSRALGHISGTRSTRNTTTYLLTTPIYQPAKAGASAYGEAVSSSTTYMTKNA